MQRRTFRAASLIASASAVLAGLTVLGTHTALAGDNGQKIDLCQPNAHYDTAQITGTNQDGDPALSDTITLDQRPCTTVHGWHWVGTVSIQWWSYPDGSPSQGTTCDVPESYDSDVFPCDAGVVPAEVETGYHDSQQDAEQEADTLCEGFGYPNYQVTDVDEQEHPEPPFNMEYSVEAVCAK